MKLICLGGETSVELTLSEQNCKAQFFGDDSSKETTGAPKKLYVKTCAFTGKNGNHIDDQDCAPSVGSSFTVELLQKRPDASAPTPFVSRCMTDTTLSQYLSLSAGDLRVPMFLPFTSSSPLMKVSIYEDAACTQAPQVTLINSPLSGEGTRVLELVSEDDNYPNDNVLAIHNPPCSGTEGNAAPPFDAGTFGKIICNANQFANYIDTDGTTVTYNYSLGQDLDLSSLAPITSSPISTAAFSGEFNGRGFSIYNVEFDNIATNTTGLFSTLSGGTIRDLNLVSPSFTVPVADMNNLGILVGEISGAASTVENIKMTDVSVSLTKNASNGNNFGAVVGSILGGSVRRIFIDGMNINTDGYYAVGGVVGYASGSSVFIDDVYLNNINYTIANSTAQNIGGAIGSMDSQANARFIEVKNLGIGSSVTPTAGANVDMIGGVVGKIGQGANLKNTRVTGIVNTLGSNRVGGLVGMVDASTPLDVTVHFGFSGLQKIIGGDSVGGVIGYVSGDGTYKGDFKRLRFEGIDQASELTCVSNCGGVLGYVIASGHILNESYVKNAIIESTGASGTSVAGLVPYVFNAGSISINSSFARNVSIVTTAATHNAGGLLGYAGAATVTMNDVYFIGDITGSSERGLIAHTCTGITLTNGYSIDSNATGASGSCYSGTVGSWSSFFSNVTGYGVETTVVSIAEIEDSATLLGAGFTSVTWPAVAESGTKRLFFEDSYRYFGNLGLGTMDSPFPISSVDAWNSIGDSPELMGSVFDIIADLDFDSQNFVPIGSIAEPFWGMLVTSGATIKNVEKITEDIPLGLISVLSTVGKTEARSAGVIARGGGLLILEGFNIEGVDGNTGALIGELSDDPTNVNLNMYSVKISNVVIRDSFIYSGKNDGVSSSAGGLIGNANVNNANTEIRNVGVYNSTIRFNTPDLYHLGGVIGHFQCAGSVPPNSLRVESLKSIDNIVFDDGGNTGVGGIFGRYACSDGHAETRKMIFNGTIQAVASSSVGGIVGALDTGRVAEAAAKGTIEAYADVGGVVGSMAASTTIAGSYTTATIDASDNGSAFVGAIAGAVTIENSFSAPVTLTGSATAGPFTDLTSGTLLHVGGTAVSGSVAVTLDYLKTEQPFLDGHLTSVDPFVFVSGSLPTPFFEIWPQYFSD